MNPVTWARLRVSSTPEVLEALSNLLVEWGSGGIVEGEGHVTAYFSADRREDLGERLRRYAADLGSAVRWTWEVQAGEAWHDAWKTYFRPQRVSPRLGICPSWTEWYPQVRDLRIVRMDPGRAFGTGAHETTRLCLRLIDDTLTGESAGALLDVGCGSGVLSLAARLLGVPTVVALDVDPVAAAATVENARRNGVDTGLAVICGDLRAVQGSYPLATANILYQVLMGIAPLLRERVAAAGRLILSGMLEPELPAAVVLYEHLGFQVLRREVDGEWGALLLRKEELPAG